MSDRVTFYRSGSGVALQAPRDRQRRSHPGSARRAAHYSGWLLVASLGLTACSSVPSLPPAPLEPPPDTGYAKALPPYRIQVGDVLDVKLLLNPELNEEVTVRPDGYISTTVVRNARAYGRTVPQLDAVLAADYAKVLSKPKVNVVVKAFAPTRIYVGGQVSNPGEFITVGPTLTLSQAIARAGGLKFTTGNEDKIFIIRRGPGDVPEFLSVRYQDVMWGQDPKADVRLAPYDVVYVPRSGIDEVYRFFDRYLLRFVNVSWGFSYVVNNGAGGTTIVR